MKRLIAISLSLLMMILSAFSVSAATFQDAPVGDKVVFKDANWAYEKVNAYGWEIDEYVGDSADPSVPWSFAKEYVTTIGSRAFSGNTNVTSVALTAMIEEIGEYAFNGCTALQNVTLFSSTNKIDVGCFYGASALTGINLQDTMITEVSAYCFAYSGVTELELPATCESIGNMAFYNCSSLSKLTIPTSVTEIADAAFLNCDNLVIYCYTDSYAHQYAEENGIDYVLIDAQIEYSYILGDSDGDGAITILDVTVILRVLSQLMDDPDGMIALRGSVDGDDLNTTHATKIQRYLATIWVPDPIGTETTRILPAPTRS